MLSSNKSLVIPSTTCDATIPMTQAVVPRQRQREVGVAAASYGLALQHRPTGVPVDLVVLVFPYRAAALAAVLSNGHRAMFVRHHAVRALHQLGVTLRTPPVLLHVDAGFALFWGDDRFGPWG